MVKGYIYMIKPNESVDDNDIYYGSTIQEAYDRFMDHKHQFNSYKRGKHHFVNSIALFEKYGFDNCRFLIIEEFEDITETELRNKEADYIDNNKCVNKHNPRIYTEQERVERRNATRDKWFEDHKEETTKPIQCECGETYTYKHKSRHLASEKHRLGTDEEYRKQKEHEKALQKEEQRIKRNAYKLEWAKKNKCNK